VWPATGPAFHSLILLYIDPMFLQYINWCGIGRSQKEAQELYFINGDDRSMVTSTVVIHFYHLALLFHYLYFCDTFKKYIPCEPILWDYRILDKPTFVFNFIHSHLFYVIFILTLIKIWRLEANIRFIFLILSYFYLYICLGFILFFYSSF